MKKNKNGRGCTQCRILLLLLLVIVLLLLILIVHNKWRGKHSKRSMEFSIGSMWNGEKVSHHPTKVTILSTHDKDYIRVTVMGQFFNDPSTPSTEPGPTDKLWDYEVVEAFFLNSKDNTYLEVEFSPHGHYLGLLLQGRKNIIHTLLPLKYSATISADGKTWRGEADIPTDYLPPNIDKFNAFAIHGTDPNRQYEQLYPQTGVVTQPDFHRLEDFQQINFFSILPTNQGGEYSDIWKRYMKTV